MLTVIEKVIFLKQVPFFADMTIDDLRMLAGIGEEGSFDPGDRILVEGEPSNALYVIITGLVGVRHRQNGGEDASLELARLGQREYFGEMSVFNAAPASADIVAIEPTDVLCVRRAPLAGLIKRQPQLAFGIISVLSQRLRRSDALLAEQLAQDRTDQLNNQQ